MPTVSDRIRQRAQSAPQHPALIHEDGTTLDYAGLDGLMDRVAAALQRDGIAPQDCIAICAANGITYAAVYLGALRAGVAVAPLPVSGTPEALRAMLRDAQARLLFIDGAGTALVDHLPERTNLVCWPEEGACSANATTTLPGGLEGPTSRGTPFDAWLVPDGTRPAAVQPQPDWPFNVIYSSGTTGTPKGIVQPFGMRGVQMQGGSSTLSGYGPEAVTLLSTPLYSNTTLVSFFSTFAHGGTVVLMAKFDALRYLQLAERHRVTHTMLVPVQYRRLLAHPDFDRHDLSAFRSKQSTSAPFPAELKAEVLRRWPGKLIESYGMTEGGGVCILEAHDHPDKLHTVGRPAPGHDIRLIDEQGRELPPGSTGEVVGRSAAMMTGYRGLPGQTAEAEWFDAEGRRYIRTGDVGRFDAQGFLVLVDRRKDLIISGGFNLYPSDLEAVLRGHADVAEVAVAGVASARWGESPVAFVVARDGVRIDAEALRAWANERLGRMQKLAAVQLVEALPRSPIGKVLKRELRQAFEAAHGPLA